MDNQHLTYFKIENFKRFDSFEMENLGQFNLIVGDNNVGKTSVLEALTLSNDRVNMIYKAALSFLQRTSTIKKWSPIFEEYIYQKSFWGNILNNIDNSLLIEIEKTDKKHEKSSIEFISTDRLSKEDIDSISKQIPLAKQPELWIRYYLNGKFEGTFGRYGAECQDLFNINKSPNHTLLRMNVTYNDNHMNAYFDTVNNSKERRLLFEEGVRYVLHNLDEVRPHKIFDKEVLGITLKNDEKIYPVTQFGDGVIKFMRILLGIISAQSKRVMIDEIDVGIHFSRLKNYWKNIFSICSKFDVQLFATTHSLECQQAFIEALEDPDMQQYQKDARNISLIENKQGTVEAVTFDFEQFEYALNIGFNTRGGKA